jgi:hypothetical protein
VDLTWLPAFIGVAGGAVTYAIGWWKDRKNEKRFLTKDAVEALTAMLNQTNAELERVKKDEQNCRRDLAAIKRERGEDHDEIFRLHQRVFELEQKAGTA